MILEVWSYQRGGLSVEVSLEFVLQVHRCMQNVVCHTGGVSQKWDYSTMNNVIIGTIAISPNPPPQICPWREYCVCIDCAYYFCILS